MSGIDPILHKFISKVAQIDAKAGLGKELYEAISQLTPSVSVDLIIRNPTSKETLLTWRDDNLYGPGWHIPGGVVRFKEKLQDRAKLALKEELGMITQDLIGPIGVHEIFNTNRNIRGHFISFVFEIQTTISPSENRKATGIPQNGQWRWFSSCPENLIPNQNQLREYL